MDDELKVHLVVVGTNEKGEDMLPASTEAGNLEDLSKDNVILDKGQRCPPFCDPLASLLDK
jgi:hypothetical protein